MNGRLVPMAEATVPFLTNALHYGTAVFEGIRSYDTERGPAVFRLRDHMQRLIESTRILGIKQLPYDLETLIDAAKQTVRSNGFGDCYIRPLVYLASGGFNLNVDHATVGVGIATWEWHQYMGPEALAKGIRANIASFQRHHVNVMMTKAKISGNYANSFLARTESMRLGFDEAIMLDTQGFVAECTGENIFLVRDGKIFTPHRTTVLEGITRDSLITIARDAGYDVIEEPISRDQLYISDEVFVCGTATEVISLREVDFRVIGSGEAGPVTRHLQQLFHAAVRGKEPRYLEWLDPVNTAVPAKAAAAV